jgi:hypothetical protein
MRKNLGSWIESQYHPRLRVGAELSGAARLRTHPLPRVVLT